MSNKSHLDTWTFNVQVGKYMTTQVIFKIDKKLKDKAMKKAQNEGISFASILKITTNAFVENQFNVGFVAKEELNSRAQDN